MRPLTIIEPPSIRACRPLAALARLPRFVDLIRTLSAHRIKVRYQHSRLGIAWALVQPTAMMLVFTLMFSLVGADPGGGVPFPLFAYAALVPWTAFASGVASASGSLTAHASLVTKVYFPREILPLTYVVAALSDLGIAAVALAGLMFWYAVPLTPFAAWAIVAVGLLAALLAGIGLLFSAISVRHRDLTVALPVLLQVWLFATPVLYPLAAARSSLPPGAYALYLLNPMAGIVDTFRRALVLHQPPDVTALTLAAVVTATLLPAAYLYFKFAEQTLADVV